MKPDYKNEEVAVPQCQDEQTRIDDRIYTVRGVQIMIDKDLAELYGVETKQLNRAVKRNIERFPEDFMFQMTKEECLRCQFGTLNPRQGQHMKYLPYAFTEYGIAMLSGVLRSETAIAVNIRIMRTFANMRKMIAHDHSTTKRVEVLEYQHLEMKQRIDRTNDQVERILKKMETETPVQGILFNGQIYDAYIFIADLVRKAKVRIVLIDKHNAQYSAIEVKICSKAHDRFLIIDDQVYLIGASIKDLGKKWFGFTLMENTSAEELLERV